MAKVDATIYIGRFNPFHLGHAHVLEKALKKSKLVVVLVGSSGQARSPKNPFSFAERRKMIENWWESFDPKYEFGRLVILPLHDEPYNDTKWIDAVQATVKAALNEDAVKYHSVHTNIELTGSDRDDSTWYLNAFPQWRQALVPEYISPVHPQAVINGTSIREVLFSPNKSGADKEKMCYKVPASTAEFLLKFKDTPQCRLLQSEHAFIKQYKASWDTAPYPPVFVTTDAVVVQSGHILAVQRAIFPGKGLWALPGGFVNQNEKLTDSVVRELIEETGIKLPESLLVAAIKTAPKEIFDNPDRSSRGRTITTAFLIRLDDTKPLPKVKGQNAPLYETNGIMVPETRKAFWLPISEALANTDKWMEDHHAIIKTMVGGKDQ